MKIYDKTHLLRVKLSPVYMVGISMIGDIKNKASGNFTNASMSEVVREGLIALFEKYGITKEAIEAAIKQQDQ